MQLRVKSKILLLDIPKNILHENNHAKRDRYQCLAVLGPNLLFWAQNREHTSMSLIYLKQKSVRPTDGLSGVEAAS